MASPLRTSPLAAGPTRNVILGITIPTAAIAFGMHYNANMRDRVERSFPGATELLSKLTQVDYTATAPLGENIKQDTNSSLHESATAATLQQGRNKSTAAAPSGHPLQPSSSTRSQDTLGIVMSKGEDVSKIGASVVDGDNVQSMAAHANGANGVAKHTEVDSLDDGDEDSFVHPPIHSLADPAAAKMQAICQGCHQPPSEEEAVTASRLHELSIKSKLMRVFGKYDQTTDPPVKEAVDTAAYKRKAS